MCATDLGDAHPGAADVEGAHPDAAGGVVLWPGRLESIFLLLLQPSSHHSHIQHQAPAFAALKALPQAAAPLFLLGLPGDLHEKVIYKT